MTLIFALISIEVSTIHVNEHNFINIILIIILTGLLSNRVQTRKKNFIISAIIIRLSCYCLNNLFNLIGANDYYFIIIPISACIAHILICIMIKNQNKGNNYTLSVKKILYVFTRSLLISCLFAPFLIELSIYITSNTLFGFIAAIIYTCLCVNFYAFSEQILDSVKQTIFPDDPGEIQTGKDPYPETVSNTSSKKSPNIENITDQSSSSSTSIKPLSSDTPVQTSSSAVVNKNPGLEVTAESSSTNVDITKLYSDEPEYEGKGKKRMPSHNEMTDHTQVKKASDMIDGIDTKVSELEKIDYKSSKIISENNLLLVRKGDVVEVIDDGTKDENTLDSTKDRLDKLNAEWHKVAGEVVKDMSHVRNIQDSLPNKDLPYVEKEIVNPLKRKFELVESRYEENEKNFLSKAYSDSESNESDYE